VIIIGTLAEMGGSLTSYAIGRRGGRPFLERYGKWVLVSHADLDRAERFFAGRGAWAVAVARVLPLVRCFASFGAGVVEIPLLPFAFFSLIGTTVWATALTLLGYNLGSTVDKFFKTFSAAGIILLVVLLGGLILHRLYAMRKHAQRETPPHNADQGPNDEHAPANDSEAAQSSAAQSAAAQPTPSRGPRAEPGKTGGRSGGAHRAGRPR
jgi:membrane protein DedA with SNARE-associated domain